MRDVPTRSLEWSAILGIQGAQIAGNSVRGIARYVREHMVAIGRAAPRAIAALVVDDDMLAPSMLEQLPPGVAIHSVKVPPKQTTGVPLYHVMSPLEGLYHDRIWPHWARDPGVGLVVTVYDMIPLLYPDDYFHGPLRRLLRARCELIRAADAILAISQATAQDVTRILGVDPAKVYAIYGGCSENFRPRIEPADHAFAALRRALPALRPGFIFSAANTDPRKNTMGLLRAYALLGPDFWRKHQLIVTCSQADTEFIDRLRDAIDHLDIDAESVIISGFVSDEVLIRLYQCCELFVFPSYYEGLGLPLIEAMRCGAATLATDGSSLREIVMEPQARFDAYSSRSIADAMTRVLDDRALLEKLRLEAPSTVSRFTWDQVARDTLLAYQDAAVRRQRIAGRYEPSLGSAAR